jgi:hypothetical protein
MHPDEFSFDLERLVEKLPTRAEGNAALRRLIAAQIEEVTAWRDLVAVSEQVELELAISTARTDVSREGALRHRYLQDHNRDQRAELRELRQWIQLRHKYGLDLQDDDEEDNADADVEEAQAGDPAGDLTEENRSEPGAPQVAGGPEDNMANSAPPAAPAGDPTVELPPGSAVTSGCRGTPPAERVPAYRENPGRPEETRESEDLTAGAPGENRSEPGASQVAGDPAVREAARRYLEQVYAAMDRGDEAAARALMLAAESAVLDAASDLFHEAEGRRGARAGAIQDGPAGRRSSG